MIHLTFLLEMTTEQVVATSVTVNKCAVQDIAHSHDHIPPRENNESERKSYGVRQDMRISLRLF